MAEKLGVQKTKRNNYSSFVATYVLLDSVQITILSCSSHASIKWTKSGRKPIDHNCFTQTMSFLKRSVLPILSRTLGPDLKYSLQCYFGASTSVALTMHTVYKMNRPNFPRNLSSTPSYLKPWGASLCASESIFRSLHREYPRTLQKLAKSQCTDVH